MSQNWVDLRFQNNSFIPQTQMECSVISPKSQFHSWSHIKKTWCSKLQLTQSVWLLCHLSLVTKNNKESKNLSKGIKGMKIRKKLLKDHFKYHMARGGYMPQLISQGIEVKWHIDGSTTKYFKQKNFWYFYYKTILCPVLKQVKFYVYKGKNNKMCMTLSYVCPK